jgi:hypothetical protein
MSDIYLPQFDTVRNHIRLARRNGVAWDDIRLNPNEERLNNFIETSFWPSSLNLEIWNAIKLSEKVNEARREENIRLLEAESNDISLGSNIFNLVDTPADPNSCWQIYKSQIQMKGELDNDDLEELELSTQKTLSRLRRETPDGPIKGMVIGHVQSGKTTSMAALMNMGADWGFNMFVVLSGRIESLRKQTEGRLQADLKSGNSVWVALDRNLNKALSNCDFRGNARHHCVVLKNPTRLENIKWWLSSYPLALANIKMLIIDDESDEAGINTYNVSNEDRTRINNLIIEIARIPARGVNYVAYTATPYANILNEGPGDQSLYPSNFIRALRSSNKYFGPRTIFGVDGLASDAGSACADGLDIIREISTGNNEQKFDEVHIIKEIQGGGGTTIDSAIALCNSIAWFLCATAVRRFWGHNKPTTMLVHTSQKQEHHRRVALAIKEWIQNRTQDNTLLSTCRRVWDHETNSFSREAFNSQFPEYRLIGNIKNYPEFDDIIKHIIEISSNINHIEVEENTALPGYHNGIHLCIDNCSYTGVNQEGEHVRLLYPDPALPQVPDFSTAFIVVGGATLSRGLTLQGLVSTYFLRDSSLGDSLLQMGRWFGYRVGYELLPRIWLTSLTKDKFRWLAGVEISLREELKRYEDAGASPAVFGPRVKRHPSLSWLRITAKNKMQAAVDVDIDYRGITNQTTMFEESSNWLNSNLETAVKFLNDISKKLVKPQLIRSSVIYKDVSFEFIKDFLKNMKFHPRNAVFGNINAFIEWFESVKEKNFFTNWNAIVAGYDKAYTEIPIGDDANNWWSVPGGCVKKVNRTRKGKTGHDGGFSIGALLSPKDRLADYEGDDLDPGTPTLEYVQDVRKQNNLDLTPLLVLYRVNKDSTYQGKSNLRFDLNAPSDLLGVAIIVPGERNLNQVGHVHVQITAAPDEADIED